MHFKPGIAYRIVVHEDDIVVAMGNDLEFHEGVLTVKKGRSLGMMGVYNIPYNGMWEYYRYGIPIDGYNISGNLVITMVEELPEWYYKSREETEERLDEGEKSKREVEAVYWNISSYIVLIGSTLIIVLLWVTA